MSSLGFCIALALALLLKPGGFSMNAPVCSTWVWMSRSTTGRRLWKPLGNRTKNCKSANIMVARVTLLLYIYEALGVFWVLEQPTNSLMACHPQLAKFLEKRAVKRVSIRMGEFGACDCNLRDLRVGRGM